MSTTPRDTKPTATVTREEFQRNPEATMKQVDREGRVIILDAQGQPVAAISRPMDRRPVIFD